MVVKTLLETGKKIASTVAKKEIEKPVYVLKEGWEKANYKLSKEQSLIENIDAFANRETGKIITEAGQGVNLKFTKDGKPYVPKGTKPSMLTKAKGWSKIAAPVVAGGTAGTIHAEIKKSKGKK